METPQITHSAHHCIVYCFTCIHAGGLYRRTHVVAWFIRILMKPSYVFLLALCWADHYFAWLPSPTAKMSSPPVVSIFSPSRSSPIAAAHPILRVMLCKSISPCPCILTRTLRFKCECFKPEWSFCTPLKVCWRVVGPPPGQEAH